MSNPLRGVPGVNSQKTVTSGSIEIPAYTQVGDLIVIVADIASLVTIDTPTGFTEPEAAVGTSSTHAVYEREAEAGDAGASVNLVWGAVSTNYIATVYVFAGAVTLLGAAGAVDTTSTENHVSPDVTFSGEAFTLEHICDKSSSPGTDWTVPAEATQAIATYQTGSGSLTNVGAYSNSDTLTSPAGGNTYSNNAVSTQTGKWTIALSPAPVIYIANFYKPSVGWTPATINIFH